LLHFAVFWLIASYRFNKSRSINEDIMKANTHPQYNELTVIRTDGTKFVTRSTYSRSTEMRLDVDPLTHPAWTGSTGKLMETGRMAKFKGRFAGVDQLGATKETATAEKETATAEKA
jgi:large subunit ribosomal protein L31